VAQVRRPGAGAGHAGGAAAFTGGTLVVRPREAVDGVGEEVFGGAPLDGGPVHGGGEGAVGGQVPDEGTEAAPREPPAGEVGEAGVVDALQVCFDRLAVLG
jgi:hypothetical protein